MRNIVQMIGGVSVLVISSNAAAVSPPRHSERMQSEMVHAPCDVAHERYLGAWFGNVAAMDYAKGTRGTMQMIFSRHACVKEVTSGAKYLVGRQTTIHPGNHDVSTYAQQSLVMIGERELMVVDGNRAVTRFARSQGAIGRGDVAWVGENESDGVWMWQFTGENGWRFRHEPADGTATAATAPFMSANLTKLEGNRSATFMGKDWRTANDGMLVGVKTNEELSAAALQCLTVDDGTLRAELNGTFGTDRQAIESYNVKGKSVLPASASRYGEVYLGDDFSVDVFALYKSPTIYASIMDVSEE